MQEKRFLSQEEIDTLCGLLARSKAIWMDPDLLNLAKSADNPSHAVLLVKKAGYRKRKQMAIHAFAQALRDFRVDLVSACVRWLKHTHPLGDLGKDIELLNGFLFEALGLEEEHERKRR